MKKDFFASLKRDILLKNVYVLEGGNKVMKRNIGDKKEME